MAQCRISDLPRSVAGQLGGRVREVSQTTLAARIDCLQEILQAFHDIADRDDIHQAASRLALVQEWIQSEAERAAADPIFVDLRLV
jgi:hypothetical protein